MITAHIILLASFVGLAVIWPMSFFGYKFYQKLTHAEEQNKH